MQNEQTKSLGKIEKRFKIRHNDSYMQPSPLKKIEIASNYKPASNATLFHADKPDQLKLLPNKSTDCRVSFFSNEYLENIDLKDPYFTSHLITYIGNKRRLLPFLHKEFLKIKKELKKDKLVVLDGFAGSGSVSRLLKAFASELHVNDFENYTEVINSAYLSNKSEINLAKLTEYINWLNNNKLTDIKGVGFIEANYAPQNDHLIRHGERVFYTNKNAKIIDNIRRLINQIPNPYKNHCLAALLIKASIHNNTSGVFKGFHKKDGVGHFGGKGENALTRIKGEIHLDVPILSDFECVVKIHKKDVNDLIKDQLLPEFDLVYYDPPYNQHPYGSNYFMLNIIANGKPCEIQNGVSGIVKNWQKSAYNKRKEAEIAMDELLKNTRSKYIAISYNNEGIIPIDTFKKILSDHGEWYLAEQDYNTYRGSRNLQNRDLKVREFLWVLKKS